MKKNDRFNLKSNYILFDKQILMSLDATENVLQKFKDAVLVFCEKNDITILANLVTDDDDNRITIFVSDYIKKTLTKKQIDSIICDYGISKSMKLFHDFQKIGLNSPDTEICDILSMEDYGIEKEIVELIINDEIGYRTDWRTTGDGALNNGD